MRTVSNEAIVEIAEMLDLHPSEVHDTMTFYEFFKDEGEKLGKTRLWVCRGLACMLRGAYELLEHCEAQARRAVRPDDGGRQDHAGVRRVHRRLRRGPGVLAERRACDERDAREGGRADRGVEVNALRTPLGFTMTISSSLNHT